MPQTEDLVVTMQVEIEKAASAGGMTVAEQHLIEMLGECWNAFCRLPAGHSSEPQDFEHSVHALQNLVMARVTARLYPKVFRGPKGETK